LDPDQDQEHTYLSTIYAAQNSWHTTCSPKSAGLNPFDGEMIMKYETLMLRSLFAACFALSALVLGAMVTTTPPTVQLASNQSLGSILLTAPTSCALPADGVVCPRLPG
jgi:hypothetical protein